MIHIENKMYFYYFIENEEKIRKINEEYNVSFEEICWIYTNILVFYKNYRVFCKVENFENDMLYPFFLLICYE